MLSARQRITTEGHPKLPKNIFLYCIIGSCSAGLDAFLFYLLHYLVGISWEIANCISVSCGICVSFILNRRYNFKVMDHPIRRAVIFFSVGLVGLSLSQSIIWLANILALNLMIAKLFSIVFVAGIQFLLNKVISFGIVFRDMQDE